MNPKMLDMLNQARNAPKPVLRDDIYALKLNGGPRTPEGKAASSRNSLRHGLTARTTVIRCEDQAEFDALLDRLTADRNPQGELEIQLTTEIAASTWCLARARQHECGVLERYVGIYDNRAGQQLQLVMRYVTAIERQLNRAIVRLEAVQAQRRKSAQFVSQSAENKPAVQAVPPAVKPAEMPAPPPSKPAKPAPDPARPLVMVAGRTQPRFASQSVDNPEPAAAAPGKQR